MDTQEADRTFRFLNSQITDLRREVVDRRWGSARDQSESILWLCAMVALSMRYQDPWFLSAALLGAGFICLLIRHARGTGKRSLVDNQLAANGEIEELEDLPE
ncbi:MAG: hypothetical protein AAFX06_24135 [Planctomycetota bacterium]